MQMKVRKEKLMREVKKIKRRGKKRRRRRKKKRKSVDPLTLRKTVRAGTISILASCSFSKTKSKRSLKARRSTFKLSHQSLSASEMTSS